MATLLESHSECVFSNRLCLHKESDGTRLSLYFILFFFDKTDVAFFELLAAILMSRQF